MEALLETKIFKVSVERLLLNGGQTLYMVGIALLIGTVIGTLLALVLVLCRKGGLVENKVLHSIVSLYINVVRSVPFIILLVTIMPLSHIQFPLGGKMKKEAREIAEQLGFCNARKHDSQDICFVPNGDYVKFMEQYTGKQYPAGAFLDLEGQTVGRHCGAVRYTLGQRKGLGLAMGEPVYVCGKNMAANTVTVGPENALYSSMLLAEDMNWISIPQLKQPMRVKAKTRYRQAEQWAAVYPEQHGRVRLEFDVPQRAVTVGQAVVLYDGDVVVGGGTICQAPPTKR